MYDMRGAIDLHIHAGPSVANRRVDAYEMLQFAEKAGYRAFVVKDHYIPSILGTKMMEKHFATDCKVIGSVCLNNSVGGINLTAADAACCMGAKLVYLPTVSAKNHIAHYEAKGKKFAGGGNMTAPETPIYYLKENGELNDEVVALLEFLAEHHPGVVIGTGHGSVPEIDKLVDAAAEIGVNKVIVNHPFYHIGASVDDMERWARKGAFIELNAVVFNEVSPASFHLPISLAAEIIRRVGPKQAILDSDMGQTINAEPTEGLTLFANLLIDLCGVEREAVDTMLKDNPAMLMGL